MLKNKRRAAALAAGLLAGRFCAAEAMKGTSMGEILWATVFLIAGIPLVIALLMYWLVVLLKDRRPSIVSTLLVAGSSWWLGLFVLASRPGPASSDPAAGWQVVLLVALLTAGCAWVSVPAAAENEDEEL